jgi:hypothetical protein
MKRRSLTLVVCLLATLSLASVGFAAWVISAGATEQLTGNILVEDVSDERLQITELAMTNKNFIFGYGTQGTNSWLKHDASDEAESLTSTITFKLSYKTDTKEVVTSGEGLNTTLTVKWDNATQTFLQGAVEKGYIKAVPTLTPSLSGKTYSVTVTFQWGELFNSENPFKWYNDHKVSDEYTWATATGLPGTKGAAEATTGTYGDHAAEFLNDMYKYFSNGTQAYTILVDAQPKA